MKRLDKKILSIFLMVLMVVSTMGMTVSAKSTNDTAKEKVPPITVYSGDDGKGGGGGCSHYNTMEVWLDMDFEENWDNCTIRSRKRYALYCKDCNEYIGVYTYGPWSSWRKFGESSTDSKANIALAKTMPIENPIQYSIGETDPNLGCDHNHVTTDSYRHCWYTQGSDTYKWRWEYTRYCKDCGKVLKEWNGSMHTSCDR